MFDGLTSLMTLQLQNNMLSTLPAGVFNVLILLTRLNLGGNPGASFAPEAVALPDDGRVLYTGGTVRLDGSFTDGGPWGANVTWSWALTDPKNGVTVRFDDAASATPTVTVPALAEGTELTFTLTVTGRGAGQYSDGFAPGIDTARVTAKPPDITAPTVTSILRQTPASSPTDADETDLAGDLQRGSGKRGLGGLRGHRDDGHGDSRHGGFFDDRRLGREGLRGQPGEPQRHGDAHLRHGPGHLRPGQQRPHEHHPPRARTTIPLSWTTPRRP